MRKNFLIHGGGAALAVMITALTLAACGSQASSAGKGTAAAGAAESGKEAEAAGAAESGKEAEAAGGTESGKEAEAAVDTETGKAAQPADKAKKAGLMAKPKEKQEAGEYRLLRFSVKSHPYEIRDGESVFANGSYDEVLLSEADGELYPDLRKALEQHGRKEEETMEQVMANMGESSSELYKDTGMILTHEERYEVIPARADSLAFSFASFGYSFWGGAHGMAGYSARNLRPDTGEEISFSEVVKKPDGFAEILYDELMKQNEDLADYVEDYEGGGEEIRAAIGSRMEKPEESLTWVLTYDGIRVYYEDYALGAYALGAREEDIRAADYPDYFEASWFKDVPAGADISDQAEVLAGAEVKRTESPVRIVRTIPLGMLSDSFMPEENPEDYFYSTAVEEFTAGEAYPRLKARLEAYNRENMKAMQDALEPYGEGFAGSGVKSSDGTPLEFRKIRHLSLARADETILSFVEYRDEDTLIGSPSRVAIGRNFDTETGEDVDLKDVITSPDALVKAVEEKVGALGYREETVRQIMDTFREEAAGAKLVSTEAFSWNLGYEGLTLHLNTEVNYNVYGRMGGCTDLFLPYADHADVFAGPYLDVPVKWVCDVETGYYPATYMIDAERDGTREELVVTESGLSPYEERYLQVYLSGIQTDLADEKFYYDPSVFLVHMANAGDYLYVQAAEGDGYDVIHCYSLGGTVGKAGSMPGALRYISWGYGDERFGETMTSPEIFRMETLDHTLGNRYVTAEYEVDYDGAPVKTSAYVRFYENEYTSVETKTEIEAALHLDGGDIRGGQKIPKGEEVRPLLLFDDGVLEVKTGDGRIWDIRLEKQGESWTYGGMEMEEVFDGLTYAG